MKSVSKSVEIGGNTITFETGKYAKQASGAVIVTTNAPGEEYNADIKLSGGSQDSKLVSASAGAVATVNADGTPAVSPKATFVVVDDQRVAFGNIRSPATVAASVP